MLYKLIDVRKGEWSRTLIAAGILLCVVASYTVVKSVRDALFLSKYGISELSILYIGLAVVTGVIVSVYIRLTGNLSRNVLVTATYGLVAVTLALIWYGLTSGFLSELLPWILYVWSSVFGVFTVMQFWLLANDLFDPREAKRLFGFLGGGATMGGALGGQLSRLANLIGTPALLLISGFLLVTAAVLANWVWPLRRREDVGLVRSRVAEERERTSKTQGGIATLRKHRYPRILGWALLLSTIATTLLDFQFKGIVKDSFAGRTNEMAAYFGTLFSTLSLVSFVLQVVATGPILRRFGVGTGLLILPGSLLAASASILFYAWIPGFTRLFAASSAKVADGSLRFAVDKASMEVMWVPVSPPVKNQAKPFVDTVMDRLGTGLTGLVWLVLAYAGLGSPARIHLISIAVMGAIGIWIAILLRARTAYVNELRQALARRELDESQIHLVLLEPESRKQIADLLSRGDERHVLFALHLLRHTPEVPLPDLANIFSNPAVNVLKELLSLLTERKDNGYREHAAQCLRHPSESVREYALIYLHTTASEQEDALVVSLVDRADLDRLTSSVLQLGSPMFAIRALDTIRETLAANDRDQRRQTIKLLGGAPPEMAAALLAGPLNEEDPVIVRQALKTLGRAKAVTLLPEAINKLTHAPYRRTAMHALRELGSTAVDPLIVQLTSKTLPKTAVEACIQVLGASGDSRAIAPLFDLVKSADMIISWRALRALSRLRTGLRREFVVDNAQLQAQVEREADLLYIELAALKMGSWPNVMLASRPQDFLERSLFEWVGRRGERIFRLLGLYYSPEDLRAAYQGLRSPAKALRASSVELLDNLLNKAVKSRILPLVEDADIERFTTISRRFAPTAPQSREELIRYLLASRHPILQACAAWSAGQVGLKPIRSELARLAAEGPPIAAAAAVRALQNEELDERKAESLSLTAVEKALRLQTVDVFERASAEDLIYVAQIAEEVQFEASQRIYEVGDAPDAMFVVLSGTVHLEQGSDLVAVVSEGEAFGSWALFDEEVPRVASATANDAVSLLKVDKEQFVEVLADRVDIVQAILKALVRRLRVLADAVGKTPSAKSASA